MKRQSTAKSGHTLTRSNSFGSRTLAMALTVIMLVGLIISAGGDAFGEETPTDASYFAYTEDSGSITITGFADGVSLASLTDLVFPATIEGIPVKAIGELAFRQVLGQNGVSTVFVPTGVTTIGDGAFSENDLTAVTLSNTISSIGSSAFAYNELTSITLPTGLTSLGEYAYRGNQISSIGTIPALLEALPIGVFMQNELVSITIPASLKTIGDSAFELNNFTSVEVPATVTSYGSRVFANNGRYVLVSGGNTNAESYSETNAYGEIVETELAVITIKAVDADENLLYEETLGVDLSNQVENNESLPLLGIHQIPVRSLSGYSYVISSPAGDVDAAKQWLTVDVTETPFALTHHYESTTNLPVIVGLMPIAVEQNGSDGYLTEAELRDGVTAHSFDGAEIADITIELPPPMTFPTGGINTSAIGVFTVKYSATDDNGTTNAYRTVTVGGDPMAVEIGDGWIYGDFRYDGQTLVGLSEFGINKYNGSGTDYNGGTISVPKTAVVLPGVNPGYTGDGRITTIKDDAFASYVFSGIDLSKIVYLETIGAGAFRNSTAASLDFSPLTRLVSIGDYSFEKFNGNNLTFGALPALKTIGEYAFSAYEGVGFELNLSGLTGLETIGKAAFYNFLGSELKLPDGGYPKLKIIGEQAFYKYSGNGIGLDFSGLKSLELIDKQAFYSYNYADNHVTFGALPKLKSIGDRAFYSFVGTGTTLDFSTGLPSLETIGVSAFNNFNGNSLIFGSVPNSPAKLHTIYCNAFNNYYGIDQILDLSGLVGLVSLPADLGRYDYGAFPSFRGTNIVFGTLPALKTIGESTFRLYRGVDQPLNFSGLIGLETIGDNSFESFNPANSPANILEIKNLPNLTRIGSQAFNQFNGTALILENLPNLVEIGASAFIVFGTAHRGEIFPVLSNLPALKIIGSEAFRGAWGTEPILDLRNLPMLETIGAGAFSMPRNAIIYLPPLVKNISNAAFFYQNHSGPVWEDPYPYFVYQESEDPRSADVTKTTPKLSQQGYEWPLHFVYTMGHGTEVFTYLNSVIVTVNAVTESGAPLGSFRKGYPIPDGYSDDHLGFSLTLAAPEVVGYVLKTGQDAKLSHIVDTISADVVELVYEPKAVSPYAGSFGIKVYNDGSPVPKTEYPIGESMKLRVEIAHSTGSFDSIPAGSIVVIPLGPYARNVAVVKADFISSWSFENGQLKVILNALSDPGGGLSFEFSQQYTPNVTPWGHEETFTAALYDPNGAPVGVTNNKNTNGSDVKLKGTEDRWPGFQKLVNGVSTDAKPLEAGIVAGRYDGSAGEDADFLARYQPGTERDVVFSYKFGDNFRRNLKSFTLTDYLPVYTKLVVDASVPGGLRMESALATFNQADNLGWTISGSTVNVTLPVWNPSVNGGSGAFEEKLVATYKLTYTGTFASPTASGSAVNNALPKLKLRFPEAMTYPAHLGANKAQIQLDVDRPDNDTEPGDPKKSPLPYEAVVTFTFTGLSTDGIYGKSINNPHTNSAGAYFYDDEDEKANTIFNWDLHFINKWDGPYENIHFDDYRLDSRMYYYGVSNPYAAQGYRMRVVAYDIGNNVLEDEIFAVSDYVFAKINQPKIDHLELYLLDGYKLQPGKRMLVYVNTKLRDPTNVHYGDDHFQNDSWGYFDYIVDGETYSFKLPYENDIVIAVRANRLFVKKSGTIVGGGNNISFGDIVDYQLRIGGEHASGVYPKHFVMVDLLPIDAEFVSVTPTQTFLESVNAQYEVVDNYQNTGRIAVVFMADELRLKSAGIFYGEAIATVRVRKGATDIEKDGQGISTFTNDVYMRADGPFTLDGENGQNVDDPFGNKLNGGGELSHDTAVFRTLRATQFVIQKEIRKGTEPFTTDGVETDRGGAFEYRYNIFNLTAELRNDIEIYDIFPYVGDTRMDKVGLVYPSRNSEFSNTLAAPINMSQFPSGTRVWYTVDPGAVTTREFLNNAANWTLTAPADLSKVRGFKIEPPDSWAVASFDTFRFVVQMIAPSDQGIALTNKLAWNSFAVSDNMTDQMSNDPVESNKVWNKIPPIKYNISAHKTDETGAPLANALLVLTDAKSGQIVQRQYSNAQGVVMFRDVPSGNYIIKETIAPTGYSISRNELTVAESDFDQLQENGTYDAGSIRNEKILPPRDTGALRLIKYGGNGAALAGAGFRVTGLDAPGNSSSVVYGNTDIVVTRFSNSSGLVNFYDLPVGNYRLEEVSAPGRLIPTFNAVNIVITKGNTLEFRDGAPIVNDKAAFTLVKIGIFDEAYKALSNSKLNPSMGMALKDVKFTLHTGDADGPIVSPGQMTTDAGGEIHFENLSPGVHYTLVEDDTPDGFTKRTGSGGPGVYDIYIAFNGDLYLDNIKIETERLVIGNDGNPNEFRIVIAKVDQNGNPVAGATFEIVPIYYGTLQTTYAIRATTDAGGLLVLTKEAVLALCGTDTTRFNYYNNSVFGRYASDYSLSITELEAPVGYAAPSPAPSFMAYPSGGYQTFTATNFKPELDIYKYTTVARDTEETLQYLGLTAILERIRDEKHDSAYNVQYTRDLTENDREAIDLAVSANPALRTMVINSGTELELRRGLAGAKIRVEQTAPVATNFFIVTTDANGAITVPGDFVFEESFTYRVSEIEAPSGYKLNTNARTFKIADLAKMSGFNGKISIRIENETQRGAIHLTKLTGKGGDPLQGVTFTINKVGGTFSVAKTTDINGLISFAGLEYGDYVIRETETVSGYNLNTDPIYVTVSADNLIIYLRVYNQETRKQAISVTKTGAGAVGTTFFLYDDSSKLLNGPGGTTINTAIQTGKQLVLSDSLVYEELATYTVYEVTGVNFRPDGSDWTEILRDTDAYTSLPAQVKTAAGSDGSRHVFKYKTISLALPGAGDGDVNIAVANEYIPGDAQFKVKKSIAGIADTSDVFTFNYVQVDNVSGAAYTGAGTALSGSKSTSGTITSAGVEVAFDTVTVLQAGKTYYFKITEASNAGNANWAYSNAYYVVKAIVPDGGGTAAITYYDAGGQVLAPSVLPAFTNTWQTGSLTVTKEVTGDTADTAYSANQIFNIVVTFTGSVRGATYTDDVITTPTAVISPLTVQLKAGRSAVITGLPLATTYAVSEPAQPSYYMLNTPGIVDSNGGAVVRTGSAVTVNNKYTAPPPPTRELSITKTVSNIAGTAPTTDTFGVTVNFTGVDLTGANLQYRVNAGTLSAFANNSTVISLRAGDVAYVSGVPDGANYAVTETAHPTYYTFNSAGSSGLTGVLSSAIVPLAMVHNNYSYSRPPDPPTSPTSPSTSPPTDSSSPPPSESPSNSPPETPDTPAPVIPEPLNPSTPPPTVPGNNIVPNDEGVLIEYDENDVPLGEWHWDPVIEEWVFDEYPSPLADFPSTQDDNSIPAFAIFFALAGATTAGVTHILSMRHRYRYR